MLLLCDRSFLRLYRRNGDNKLVLVFFTYLQSSFVFIAFFSYLKFKRTMKKHFTFLLFLSIIATASAQRSSFQQYPVLDLNFAMGFPVGEFAEATNDAGFGVDLGLYFPVSQQANWFKVGAQFMGLITGSNTQRKTENLEVSIGGQVIDVIELPLRIVTSNSLIGGHGVVRTHLPTGVNLEPYAQGLIGFRRLATTVRIYDESDEGFFNPDDDEDLITKSTPLESWVFSYGFGGGVQIKLGRTIFLNLGANFLFGGEAEYYTKKDIDQFAIDFVGNNYNPSNPNLDPEDIQLNIEPTRSKTSIIQGNVGITLMFEPQPSKPGKPSRQGK